MCSTQLCLPPTPSCIHVTRLHPEQRARGLHASKPIAKGVYYEAPRLVVFSFLPFWQPGQVAWCIIVLEEATAAPS